MCPIPYLGVSPAGAQNAAAPRNAGIWPMAVGCGCVAVVLAFLAGLGVRKRYRC